MGTVPFGLLIGRQLKRHSIIVSISTEISFAEQVSAAVHDHATRKCSILQARKGVQNTLFPHPARERQLEHRSAAIDAAETGRSIDRAASQSQRRVRGRSISVGAAE